MYFGGLVFGLGLWSWALVLGFGLGLWSWACVLCLGIGLVLILFVIVRCEGGAKCKRDKEAKRQRRREAVRQRGLSSSETNRQRGREEKRQ